MGGLPLDVRAFTRVLALTAAAQLVAQHHALMCTCMYAHTHEVAHVGTQLTHKPHAHTDVRVNRHSE
jgi:hypothetical protein